MPVPVKQKIFVSYTTIDKEINRNLLLSIENNLQNYGEVYIDLLHNDDLVEPQKKVINKLINSDLLIVINSKNIKESKWVNLELKIAQEKKIRIIFLNIEDITKNDFKLNII